LLNIIVFTAFWGCVELFLTMRTKSTARRERQTRRTILKNLVEEAGKTSDMLGIQRLIKDAENAPVEVQKGIIQIGLQRHLYPFQPRQKQVDTIWHLVFKKKIFFLQPRLPLEKVSSSKPLRCSVEVALASSLPR
jgi:hypothetical protein